MYWGVWWGKGRIVTAEQHDNSMYMLQDIGYQKHCNEFTVTRCRTVYDTSSEERCWTVYKKKCSMVYEREQDWEYQQKCSTTYEEECHGYGYHQECQKVGVFSKQKLYLKIFRFLKSTASKCPRKGRRLYPGQSASKYLTKGVRTSP